MTIQEPIGWQDQKPVKLKRWTPDEVRAEVAVILTVESVRRVTVDDFGAPLSALLEGAGVDALFTVLIAAEDEFDVLLSDEETAKIVTAEDLALAVLSDLSRQCRAG